MELVSFSVQNFRSITKAHRLRIGKQTVLIGPNNEGKSNLLRSLVLALRMLEGIRVGTVYRGRSRGDSRFYLRREQTHFDYDWRRDYPVHLQEQAPTGASIFALEFALSEDEVEEFRTEVGSRLNGTLPVELSLGRERLDFRVPKRGPGGAALSQKRAAIASFVSKRVNFEYIRAIRTAEAAEDVVEQMVARELEAVEQNEQYKAALKQIADLQRPVLEKLSKSIKETLSVFLPDVNDARVRIADDKRYRALRQSCEIIVDDGTPTQLRYKGDGIQSLAALSLMRHASESGSRGRHLLIAIEEPESHLHPRAIHQLRGVLQELASKHRLVVTTHCPLLVDRVCVENNIIVAGNRAKHAGSVEEIRRTLGVRAADNLQHAELVLVVEGEDDKKALRALLAARSKAIAQALQNGTLAIESLNGGNNLAYKLGMLRDALCLTHAFMDNDSAGLQAAERAREEGLLPESELHVASCRGLRESELEDLYDTSLYEQMLKTEYTVSVDVSAFRSKQKWSDRLSDVFRTQGKRWDAQVEMNVKARVASLVSERPDAALSPHKESVIDGLKAALEERLATLHAVPKKAKSAAPPEPVAAA